MTLVSGIQKYKLRTALLACALIAGLWLLARWWEGPLLAAEQVVRRDFVQTVVASGHVENPHRVEIGTQLTGTVRRIPVQEGQTVRAGDTLIELTDAELNAAVRQADSATQQAQARLRQLREVQRPVAEQTLRQSQINLDNARATLQRNEDLFNKKFISEAALDETRKAVELAQAQWRSSQKQLESIQASGSDFAVAQTAVTQAQAGADTARARQRYAHISAPVDGVLISRNVEVGDVVQPGKALMTLSPQGRSQLLVSIDEKNLRLIALGQSALVSADAYPQQRFEARLVFINPGINAQTGSVDVKLDIDKPPAYLRQDMTVSVDIEVARRPQALLVPLSAVHDVDGSTPWVWRVAQGRAHKVAVQAGLRSGGLLEVVQGLAQGDWVLTGSTETAALREGARVRTGPVAP